MAKDNDTRRAFLKGAVAGAGAGAVAALAPVANAQTHQMPGASAEALPQGERHGAFFNDEQATTVTTFAERLMPGAPGKPGATEAGVVNYIDLALAGAYSDQQEFYRRGLDQLDAYCQATHKAPFAKLPAAQQDEVIAALEEGKATGFQWPAARSFFETVRTHTMEGMFADPVYGGNKDFAGWRLVGFPGAQPAFTGADLKSREAFSRAPILGLQSQASRKA
jgi:gluconate 2-dehydrogenase gamma chain